MQLLNGKERSQVVLQRCQLVVNQLKQQNILPKLVVITVGEDPASKVYVGQKEKRAIETGLAFEWVKLPEETTQIELNKVIQRYNDDEHTSGLIVQFPLPKHLDKQATILQIDATKDVDGFHPENMGAVALNQAVLYPCTPKGVIDLLDAYAVELRGKNIVVIGASHVVGLPLSIMLINREATVTVCQKATKDFSLYTKEADIVIVAAGCPNLLNGHQVKEGVVVVDVGITRLENGKITGDVNFDEVKEKASYITPVPGGVGPMTVAMLVEQTVRCACLKHGIDFDKIQ